MSEISSIGDSVHHESVGWAWWDNQQQQFRNVYPTRFQVAMCSPDGFETAIKNGEGEIQEIVISTK